MRLNCTFTLFLHMECRPAIHVLHDPELIHVAVFVRIRFVCYRMLVPIDSLSSSVGGFARAFYISCSRWLRIGDFDC